MKIDLVLREAHAAEVALAAELTRVRERHPAEHDVFHLATTLRSWCERHLEALVAQGERYDATLATPAERGGGEEEEEDPIALLRDVRDVYLAAARASLAWTMLGQGAQAVTDAELLAVVDACHPETIRTMKWAVQKVKDAAPQALSS